MTIPHFETHTVEVDGEPVEVHLGSGNVFVDLGFENAAEMTLKADLAVRILRTIRERRLTPKRAAQVVGLDQTEHSNIVNARLENVSVERLFAVLNRLGHQVEIHISREESENARTLVAV